MLGRKPPPNQMPGRMPGSAPTRIAGQVDPQVLERARQAMEVKVAKTRIKSMARDEAGARKVADALRKLMQQ